MEVPSAQPGHREFAFPPVAHLLSRRIDEVDLARGVLRLTFTGTEAFGNPAGHIAGGLLAAMLDDLTALMVDATAQPGQGVVTLSLNVSFLRPARAGEISGVATLVRRGRELCHVDGMLQQDGKDVAWAVAICKVVDP